MHRLTIQLFGGPVLLGPEGAISLSPAQAALLGVVAAHGERGVARSVVRGLLWPSEEGPRVAHRLAQLQYALNRRAGAVVVVAEGEVLHLDGSRIQCDLSRFEDALVSGEGFPGAVAALEGGFLRGLESTAADVLLDWISARTLSLRSQLRREAAAHWVLSRDRGDWPRSTELAEVLLSLDPEDEGALQRLLRSRAMSGGVQEAETVYRIFEERRRAEGHEWSPSRTTSELLDRIRTMEQVAWLGAGASARGAEDAPLTGRDAELRRLEDALRAPLPEELDIVILSGEAGIGKTRLLREALSSAPLGGVWLLRGSSGELERDIPLNPLLEALTPEWVGEAIQELEEPWRTVLLGLLPQFHLGPGPVPEAPTIRPGALPRRLFEAIRILLESLSRARPLVLVLDDFHWADDTTVTVLDYIRRRWREGGVRIVLCVRPEALYDRPSVSALLDQVRSRQPEADIVVGELEERDAILLVERVSHRPLDSQEREQVCALAGSNPFFLIELTQERLAGRLPGYPPPLDDLLPIPLSIRQIFEDRLGRLGAGARRCADLLSVHELPLELRTLRQLARLSRTGAIEALEELQALRLISWTPDGVVLRHAIVVQTVYTALSPPRRRWLHGRIAGSLLSRDPHAVDRLALHFDRAGVRSQALHFAHEAADRAEHAGAVAEALRYLGIARRYTTEPPEVATILGRIAHLHYLHRDFREAASLLDLAAARFRELGRLAESLQARIERIDALSQRESLPPEDFLDELARIKDEAREGEHWEELARALDVEVHLLDRNGMVDAVRECIASAEGVLRRHPPPAAASALNRVVAFELYYGDPARATSASREAVRLARVDGSRRDLLNSLNRLLVVLLHQGHFDSEEGRIALADAEALASRTGDVFLRFNVRLNTGVWALDIGDLDRAERAFARASEVVRGDTHGPRLALLCNLGELQLARGDYTEAYRTFSRAEETFGNGMPQYLLGVLLSGKGLAALSLGRLTEAGDLLERLPPDPPFWYYDPSLIALFRARTAYRLKGPEQAMSLLEAACNDIQGRMVTNWVKLRIELHRFQLRRPRPPREAILDTLETAKVLGLARRVEELNALLPAR